MARSTEVDELDIQLVFDFADDSNVEIVDAAVDYNAEHGANSAEEMDV